MRNFFRLNVWLATFFLYFVFWFFSTLPFHFETVDPISEAFKDVDLTDMVFNQLREENDPDARFDEEIVIVNIQHLSRAQIGKQLEIINKYEPSVIGIDAFFRSEKSPSEDFPLMMAMAKIENLVLVSELANPQEDGSWDTINMSNPIFQEHAKNGFANVVTGESTGENFRTVRFFPPHQRVRDSVALNFVSKIVQIHNPEAFEKMMARDHETEVINWRGKYNKFFSLGHDQVLNEDFDPDIIKGKIVLFGYIGDYIGDENSTIDKFYTPLNERSAGRAYPDMYGIVVHANAISMMIHGNYIDQIPGWLSTIIALIFTYINIYFFLWVAKHQKHYYDLITKTFQLVELIAIYFVIVMVFNYYHIKLDLTLLIVAVALGGDITELYAGSLRDFVMSILKKMGIMRKDYTIAD